MSFRVRADDDQLFETPEPDQEPDLQEVYALSCDPMHCVECNWPLERCRRLDDEQQ